MDFEIYSYRYAKEIIEHPNYQNAYQQIIGVIRKCPLFMYPKKSASNAKLDIVQQLLNTYFDRRFACDLGWLYHPNATSIAGSGLAADFRKNFHGLRIQTEVQFGNMARWYSDIFKFQTAYSQDLIDIGLCIVPMSSIASRMDSNVAYFERCMRELPSAKLSITLPILMIGLRLEQATPLIDVSHAALHEIGNINRSITGRGRLTNKYRIIHSFLSDTPIAQVNDASETGPMASLVEADEEE